MSSYSWRNRLYSKLLRAAQESTLQRHCAYMAAGWLSLFLVRPTLPASQAPSAAAVVGGGVLLVVALLLLGPALNALQPALRAAGQAASVAPVGAWPLALALAFLAWRYMVGRKLLTNLAASSAA